MLLSAFGSGKRFRAQGPRDAAYFCVDTFRGLTRARRLREARGEPRSRSAPMHALEAGPLPTSSRIEKAPARRRVDSSSTERREPGSAFSESRPHPLARGALVPESIGIAAVLASPRSAAHTIALAPRSCAAGSRTRLTTARLTLLSILASRAASPARRRLRLRRARRASTRTTTRSWRAHRHDE